MTHHLAGSAEVAAILGVTRQRVAQLVADDPSFPRPVAVLSCGRIWDRETVQAWSTSSARTSANGGRRSLRDVALDTSVVVAAAGRQARSLHDTQVRVEHLWMILDELDGPGGAVLAAANAPVPAIRDRLRSEAGQRSWSEPDFVSVTPRVDHVIVGASFYAAELRDARADSRHLLLSLLDEWGTDRVSQSLASYGVGADAVRDLVFALDQEA